MELINTKLAALRAAKQLTTREMAAAVTRAGYTVSHTAVGNYESETGTAKIPAGYLAAVCRLFGLSPNWLLLDLGPPDLVVEEAGDPYRQGRRDLAASVAELLLPELVEEPATSTLASRLEALDEVRRHRGKEEEGRGAG